MCNIIIIVVVYFVCFVFVIVYGLCVRRDIDVLWLEFFVFFFIYFISVCNLIVYLF